MPLAKVEYGPNAGARECILEKWIVDPSGISGSYTADPVENCIKCNFYDAKNKKHPLDDEDACTCPPWMRWKIYDYLRDFFADNGDNKKTTFQKLIYELSKREIIDLESIKKINLVSIMEYPDKSILNKKNSKLSLEFLLKKFNLVCEDDKTVKKIIEGKVNYNDLPYDQENEVKKGYYFKEQAEFIKEYESKNKKAMCSSTEKECLKERCKLYDFPKSGAAEGWVCREYKVYFLQK